MKVVVLGANGQLGSDLVEVVQSHGSQVIPLTHEHVDIQDLDQVRAVLTSHNPHLVLNTAAYHNVPKCEQDPDRAFAVNAHGALNVAQVTAELDAVNVYYSTDYVFDGTKRAPYLETDAANPLNVYGASKFAGEFLTLNYNPQSFVVRISGIYGIVPCRAKGGNFITTMQRVAREKPEARVVADEILTPTSTDEIALKTLTLIGSQQYGLYHLTCEGECSWYEFAREIFDALDIRIPLYPTSINDQPSPVKRPSYSVLENHRFNRLGETRMPHWRVALRAFLEKMPVA